MNFYYSPADSPLTKYKILNEDQLVYSCQYEELTFTKKLFDKDAELVATGSFNITNRLIPLRLQPFTIKLHKENADIRVHFKMLMLTHYYFEYKKDIYKGIFHFGTRISIFKNDQQIGYYNTNRMKLTVNKDENVPLLLLFSLHIYSDFRGEDADGGNPKFNIVFPLRRFDKNWKPTQ